jgi:hypothetical protein
MSGEHDQERGGGGLRLIDGSGLDPFPKLRVANDHKPPVLHVKGSRRLDRSREESCFF